jgi:hypothetical protein
MKVLKKILIFFALLTGATVLGAAYLHIHWMYTLAGISLGVVVIASALDILITGKTWGAAAGMSQFYRETKHTERYSGAPARMIGVVALLFGCIAIAASVIDATTPGGIDVFWDGFLQSPRAWGLITGLAGFIVTIMGIIRAKVGSAAAPGAYNKVIEAGFRMGGIFRAVLGAVMMLIAGLLITAPGALQRTLDGLWQAIVQHVSP